MNQDIQLPSSRTQFHAVVKGRVQGVGYRNWTYSQARLHKATGSVRNLPDGSVEIVAEGNEADLQGLLNELRTGPKLAKILDVNVTWSTVTCQEFSEFIIRKS